MFGLDKIFAKKSDFVDNRIEPDILKNNAEIRRSIIDKYTQGQVLSIKITKRWFFWDGSVEYFVGDAGLDNTEPQRRYPVMLFNYFDFISGYSQTIKKYPPLLYQDNTPVFFIPEFFTTYIRGRDQDLRYNSNQDNIIIPVIDEMNIGDVCLMYGIWSNNPGRLVYFTIESDQNPYVSIMGFNEKLRITKILFRSNTELQYNEEIRIIKFDNFGNISTSGINPLAYKDTDYQQTLLIEIKEEILLTQFIGLMFYNIYECTEINFDIEFKL